MIFPNVDHTHDPALTSWVESANGHPAFPIQNLPYGIFSPADEEPRPGVAIGDHILDLRGTSAQLAEDIAATLDRPSLNALLDLPRERHVALRHRLIALLSEAHQAPLIEPHLHPRSAATLHLPVVVGDYTDFYVGIHHATNVGRLFRPQAPLLPNYKHVPIAYHGRASSVCVSGADVFRPQGQWLEPGKDAPCFGPSQRLDFELELGLWVGSGNRRGRPIPIGDAFRHVGGFCLLNDWSARDIQTWEYQPLGPFLAKNFCSTVSPWIVTPEALAPFFRPQPKRPAGDPHPLPYLWDEDDQQSGAIGITAEVGISTARMREQGLAPHHISRSGADAMYWTFAQMIAHHSSNGCNLNSGDLLGSGTLSGQEPESFGSLIELTDNGNHPLTLPTGEQRAFLQDGDEIMFSAYAEARGFARIGFGECVGRVVPASPAA